MKSERRHELQHNALREWLTVNYERIQPYQNTILGVVLLVAVAFLAVSWWNKRSASHDAAAWDAMFGALKAELPADQKRLFSQNPLEFLQRYGDPQMAAQRDPAKLDKVAEKYPNTPAGDWAAVMSGDLHQLAGAQALFTDKAEANKQLSEAVRRYEMVKSSAGPLLRQRAMFGLAQTLESQGRIEEAANKYQELAKTWPDGMFAKTAEQRAKDLKKPELAQFYKQFEEFRPQPPPPPKEETSAGPASKSILTPPSDNPPDDTSIPSSFGKFRPKEEGAKTEASSGPVKPGTEKKTEAAAEKTAEKPVATPEPPAEKTAATPEKPAAKTPEAPAAKTAENRAATPDKPAEKTPAEKPTEKPPAVTEKPAEKTPEPPAEKTAEKPAEKTAEKPAEKTAEPTPEPPAKPAEKPEEKTEKTGDKAAEKPVEKTPEKTGDGK
jgi:tetratricopeptide (TPR) repeat protein